METAPGTRCFRCGCAIPGDTATCPGCGASLFADVVVEAHVEDSRAAYLAARAIDELGGEAPGFARVKSRLLAAPGVVAHARSSVLARGMVAILRRHGIQARLVPARRPRQPEAVSRFVLATDLLAARIRRAAHSLPTAVTLAISGLVIVVVLVLAGPWRGGGREQSLDAVPRRESSGDRVSVREIAFAAVASSARVSCRGSSGLGFFVERERLLASLEPPCVGGAEVEVLLAGGRTLVGTVERLDGRLDLAMIHVPGAQVAPLELGDATRLELGDPVVTCQTSIGRELAVTQGIVAQPVFDQMGISYLLVDGVRPHQDRGGPVLDRSGQVVGVSAGGAAAGRTIPVNYLCSGDDPLVKRPCTGAERARWIQRMERTSAAELDELRAARESTGSTALSAAELSPRGRVRVTVVRRGSPPPGERLGFRLLRDGALLCQPVAGLAPWRPVGRGDPEVGSSGLLSWLVRHRVPGELYLTTGSLDLTGCPGPATLAGSLLVLDGGDPREDRVTIVTEPRPAAAR